MILNTIKRYLRTKKEKNRGNMNGMNDVMMKMNNGSGMGNMNMDMKVSIPCLFFFYSRGVSPVSLLVEVDYK